MTSSDFKRVARKQLIGKKLRLMSIFLMFTLIELILILVLKKFIDQPINKVLFIAFILINIPLFFGLTFSLYDLFFKKSEDVKIFDFLILSFKHFIKAYQLVFYKITKLIIPILLLIISSSLIILSSMKILETDLFSSIFNILKKPTDLFNNLTDLFNSLADSINTPLIIILASSILFIISLIWLIIKSYSYIIAKFIAFDNLNMPAKEIIKRSKTLMKKNRAKLFGLHFSFIGYYVLIGFIITIGYYITVIIPMINLFLLDFNDKYSESEMSIFTLIGIPVTIFIIYIIVLFFVPRMKFATISFYKHLINSNTANTANNKNKNKNKDKDKDKVKNTDENMSEIKDKDKDKVKNIDKNQDKNKITKKSKNKEKTTN